MVNGLQQHMKVHHEIPIEVVRTMSVRELAVAHSKLNQLGRAFTFTVNREKERLHVFGHGIALARWRRPR